MTQTGMRIDVYAPIIPNIANVALRRALIKKARGVSTQRCHGTYLMPDGAECTEHTDIHTIFIEDTDESRMWLETLMRNYKAAAEQSCVLYVINGCKATFITD